MAKKRITSTPPPAPAAARAAVTPERFSRLHRLLTLLGSGSKSRDDLKRALGLDVRGFYRDLEMLRASGIEVNLVDGSYSLANTLDEAVSKLPFPDLHLTLGEVRQLIKGKSALHLRLNKRVNELQQGESVKAD